jgi:hypothetical protein
MDPEQRPTMPPGWLPPTSVGIPPAPPAPVLAPEPQRPSGLRRLLGLLFVAGAFALKFGKVALLALPKLKIFTTSGSMLVSIAAYSLIWGWRFALGFVVLLFIHEMGHVLQLRREGIQASAPMFIPFLGAVISAKSLGRDAAAEARVGLAGPDPGDGRRGRVHPARRRHGQRALHRAGLHRVLPEPLQPPADHAPGRRARDGRPVAVDVVRRPLPLRPAGLHTARTRSSCSSCSSAHSTRTGAGRPTAPAAPSRARTIACRPASGR